jgi:carbamoyltransferase
VGTEPLILGIGASHNGAVCLMRGRRILVAIQEERLTRVKRDRIFGAKPCLAIKYCLSAAGVSARELDAVVLCVQGRASTPEQDITVQPALRGLRPTAFRYSIGHHLGHAWSAFATSGFREAAILVVDGMGSPLSDLDKDEQGRVIGTMEDPWESYSFYRGRGKTIECIKKFMVPNGCWIQPKDTGMSCFGTLGGMYSAVAHQIFGDYMDAGKVMGLSPFGKAIFPPNAFFEEIEGRIIFKDHVPRRFNSQLRWPDRKREYEALAASAQHALEVALLSIARRLRALSRCEFLAYAGGVALNCVANEKLIQSSLFQRVHVVPAADDAGTALGAALFGAYHLVADCEPEVLKGDDLGRPYDAAEITGAIAKVSGAHEIRTGEPIETVVHHLTAGGIVGWFDGRSELGPRALGSRSILADPRNAEVKDRLNLFIKKRERFRPFAPIVLLEGVNDWFQVGGRDPESPFMLRVFHIRDNQAGRVPAIVHVDGSARVQTVRKGDRSISHLISRFHEITGVPILLNTSFNGPGEPIVETPLDALRSARANGLTLCWLDGRIVLLD